MDMGGVKNAFFGAPSQFPSATMGFILVLIMIILYQWWSNKIGTKEKVAGKKPAKKNEDEDESEFDELIDEIHQKQKKKSKKE